MKSILLAIVLIASSLLRSQNEYLLLTYDDEIGGCGYLSESGDTIIPFGKYLAIFTDTFYQKAIVLSKVSGEGFMMIDRDENRIFEIFPFDNGPDYTVEGLFRIVENEQVGFANSNGVIVILPRFAFAFPFENGVAEVTLDGTREDVPDSDYYYWKSESWFFIDKTGRVVEKYDK